MYNPFSLLDKTVLITGASSGIGRSISIECSKMGAKVLITGRDKQRLQDTFNELDGIGHTMYAADLNNGNDLNGILDSISNLDGIVNAAGIIRMLPFQYVNELAIKDIFNTNFFSPVALTQKIVKSKKIKHGGSIVFLSSIEGTITAHAGNSMYAASKGAISALAKSIAIDLAPKRIRVNCILPGMIETPLIQFDSLSEEQLNADKRLYPLKRYGKPEEVAYAAIYLLSDASCWVTGTNLIVDGGFSII